MGKLKSAISYNLIYNPTLEPDEKFQKRFDEVQSIMIRMVLIGRKKGRAVDIEVSNETAA